MSKIKYFSGLCIIILLFFVYACDDSSGDQPGNNDDSGDNDNNNNKYSLTLKVMTYNVIDYNYSGYSGDEHEAVAGIIETSDIDVIAVEEAPAYDTEVISILDQNNITMYYAGAGESNDNLAVYSRYTIKSSNEIITGTYEDPVSGVDYNMSNLRPVLEVCIDVEDNDCWFYVCHLKAYSDSTSLAKRRAQSYALSEYLKNKFPDIESERIIVLGDMNTVSDPDAGAYDDWDTEGTMGYLTLQYDSDSSNDLTAVNYTYIPDQATYPSYGSLIDHIIASPGLMADFTAENTRVVKSPKPSDHYPVYAEFFLE